MWVDGRVVEPGQPHPTATVEVVEDRAPGGAEGAVPSAPSVVRRRLRVVGTGHLERFEVEPLVGGRPLPPVAGPADDRALGQPQVGRGWFATVAHPGAEGLSLAVDTDLGSGPWVSPPAIVGRTSPGRELSGFWDEVDRARPAPPRVVTLANNWYQLGFAGNMSEATVLAELEGFGEVARRHRLDLDYYCLDDPWDGGWEPSAGLWGRLDPARFPGGLGALQATAQRVGVGGIGLWVSPFGGYFDRHDQRVAWGRAQGFEVHDGDWPCLCPAGDTYRRHLAASLGRFGAAGVGYWKLDGAQFDCPEATHGHRGRTDQMDRFAALLDGLRAAGPPGTVLAFTTGSNPSPWWLRHADFLWRGGLDDDAPAGFDGGRHERFATYIDSCLDALRPTALPVSAIVTFSVVENEARAYQEEGEGPEEWERHCWLLAARGSHHHDLYVAPGSLRPPEWDALARVLRWSRANQQALARSRMVGGRPQAGEPYGFVAEGAGQVIVCLRNPAGRPQQISIEVPRVARLVPVWGGPVIPSPGQGASSTVRAELGPFEVVVAQGPLLPAP